MGKLKDLNSELLENSAYSPNCTVCDLALFPSLKKFLAGENSGSNKDYDSKYRRKFCRGFRIKLLG